MEGFLYRTKPMNRRRKYLTGESWKKYYMSFDPNTCKLTRYSENKSELKDVMTVVGIAEADNNKHLPPLIFPLLKKENR